MEDEGGAIFTRADDSTVDDDFAMEDSEAPF